MPIKLLTKNKDSLNFAQQINFRKDFMRYIAFVLSVFALSYSAYAKEVDYGFSGQAKGLYGYSDISDHNHANADGHISSYISYDFNADTTATLYLDLMGGIDKEIQDYNQGRWGEEVYGEINSAYGLLMAGQTWNVASLFHDGASMVGAITSNNDIVDFIANPNWQRDDKTTIFSTLNSTDINTDGVAPKINYISPEYFGTAVGFSYIPDSYNRRGLENKHAGYAHHDAFVAALYSDHDFGWFSAKTSVGYGQYHGNDKDYSLSLRLSRGNWSLGGGFRKTYIDGEDKSSPAWNLPSDFDAYREGYAWNIGLGYEIGPFSSSLTYFNTKSDKSDNCNKIVAFSNQYEFNKYIDIYLAAAYADNSSAQETVHGYVLISGIGVNF